MASPQMRVRSELPESAGKRRRSALRLLGAERSEEIFPVLVEEIVALGHPRALIAKVDFETSEILPIASLNCSKSLLAASFALRFTRSKIRWCECCTARSRNWFQAEASASPAIYYHPLVYRNKTACWEAERAPPGRMRCRRKFPLAAETAIAGPGLQHLRHALPTPAWW